MITDEKTRKRHSKFLSLLLRHRPETIGLVLDAEGWASVVELLQKLEAHDHPMSREVLEEVVATNVKQRFRFSEDGTRIRANQGHSVSVDLGYVAQSPPEYLYHGTATKNLASIRGQGLLKGTRHHVHLSADLVTAKAVGSRHGVPVILRVPAKAMETAGYEFFLSDNGVWLTDHVPSQFLQEDY